MKDRITTLQPARRNASSSLDKLYRRARKSTIATEDQALNALCDARLRKPGTEYSFPIFPTA
jgi:hypothetical protein